MTDETKTTPRPPRVRNALALITALLITATLGLAAAGKLMGPDENKLFFGTDILLDHVVAGVEILLILLVLALHRTKLIWPIVTVVFAGFFGYATYWTLTEGKPCGCFGELWEPPLGVSMGMDAVFAIAGLALAFAYGGRAIMLAVTFVIALGAGWVGYDYAYNHSPEKALAENEGVPTPVRFLESDMMTFAREAPDDAPAYMIFVHEKGCEVCERYLRDMEFFGEALEERDDELLRIREFPLDRIEVDTGIAPWEWPAGSPPVVFVVQWGEIITVPGSQDFEKRWYTGDETPLDIIRQTYEFMGGDWMALEDDAYAGE